MSVVFFILSVLFFTTSFARHKVQNGKGTSKISRPSENKHKLRIVIQKECCSEYDSIRRSIFSNYECLERSKTSNKNLQFRKDCVIYAKINDQNDENCYEDLREDECIRMIHFEPIYYVDSVDYTDDNCILQDVSQDDPCLLVYSPSNGADGTECARTYLEDAIKPFYHLNYWYPDDEIDSYAYIYLDTTGVSNVENIDVWILDSGIDRNHVEFEGIDIEKISYEIDDPETFSDHGTAVASNAIGNNIGIARGFTVKDCPVCQDGSSCAYEDIENCMIEVINYYSTRPGRRFVINMSFGGPSSGTYIENFDDMVDAGGILVAAAGNDRSNNDLVPQYPANDPLVIAVGGYNQHKSIYDAIGGSNYGTNSVRYYAAAEYNLVALASANAPNGSDELYTYFEGTSFASPIVTGEVANILARDLSLTVEDIRAELDLRVSGNVLNCPVESCPMIGGYCNAEALTRNPTAETRTPTLEPTNNPTVTSINPTMAPTILHSCLTDICQNVGISINDNSIYTSSINLDRSDIFQVFPMFKSIKIRTEGTHTWQSDLKMTLTSPDNTQIILADDIGGSDNNFNITFSDEADSFPLNLNVNGNEYKPLQSFSTFGVQSPIGTWTFSLADEYSGDEGIWESWCISEICFDHEEGTQSPTSITRIPTNNPTSNPVSKECINNICKNVGSSINDYGYYTSNIFINESDIGETFAIFESMKISTEGTHSWQSDLKMTLTSPNNTQIILADDVGDSNDNFNITFSDDAISFPSDLNVNGDEYKPSESFSNFDSESVIGIWIFGLEDEFGGDEGFWNSWCITELCFYKEDTQFPTINPSINPSVNPTSSPSEEPEENNRCCRATRAGRLINYQCRQFNRRQCNNDVLCRYRENAPGC